MDNGKNYKNIKGDQIEILDDGKVVSVYYKNADDIFKKLNKVSPSFCLAKWFNVSIHLTTGRTHSCYHPPSHQIPVENIIDQPHLLHNTDYKKTQRKLMLEGKRPKECEYCWKIEDSSRGQSL